MRVGTLVIRAHFGRFFLSQFVAALATAAFLSVATPSWAARESSIVIEAETGKVLSEHNADLQNYPASLTKMMTLYLLFDALEHGKVKLDQQFTVSRWAAAQAPSKLGLMPGQTISVHDLILGIVTKSANDAAVTVAENMAGSESAFAERMTQQARALGMMHTTYHNASGLPNPGQLSTARDLSKLALALYHDFPKEYAYFSTTEFTYNGATYANHNHLMRAFQGMDGIKTGYIRASGFNLAASAVRNNRRLIGVVMGGQSAHSRDIEMAKLLNDSFANRTPTVMTAANDDDQADSAPTLTHRAERTLAALSPVAPAEAATPAVAHSRHGHHHEAAERWSIQVGAYAQHAAAEKAGTTALGKLPAAKGRSVQVMAPGHNERYYRVRIVNFSERDAEKACRLLHRKHVDCAVIAPLASEEAAATAARRG